MHFDIMDMGSATILRKFASMRVKNLPPVLHFSNLELQRSIAIDAKLKISTVKYDLCMGKWVQLKFLVPP